MMAAAESTPTHVAFDAITVIQAICRRISLTGAKARSRALISVNPSSVLRTIQIVRKAELGSAVAKRVGG
jgi:hypothetical protein